MNIEELRDFCLSLKGAEEKMPFDDKTLVFTVKGKMFCDTDITNFEFINLKFTPEEVIRLREEYEEITEGYYMNKKHWNSVKVNSSITDQQLKDWITDSYKLVVLGLPKKVQKELSEL
ncbi:MAG: MmcQ/YjbR family DNA-binding protein [Capnocytophaga sp.]|nr:MmcQ/YjbR family DNA-binding protein [Capnocytophaga sp.]